MALPSIRLRPARVLPVALAAWLWIGCAPQTPTPSSSDALIAASLASAEDAVTTIRDPVSRIDALVELGEAQVAAGHPEEASNSLATASALARSMPDPIKQAQALVAITSVWVATELRTDIEELFDMATAALEQSASDAKRWDLAGQLAVARARGGDVRRALTIAQAMPARSETLATYKARTLHDIAPSQASFGDFGGAVETLDQITMGLTYYRSVACSDVAAIAGRRGNSEVADSLLAQADDIARKQSDGYFVAGALRQIGDAYAELGVDAHAHRYYSDALLGAMEADQAQQRSRALSRVATSMADYGYLEQALAVIPRAIKVAQDESSDQMRFWAYYEIAGSAAFSGDFESALSLLNEIPSDLSFSGTPLRDATQRDIAWGLARHGQLDEALEMARSIQSARERVQALSRIVRVLSNPAMKALPRYL